jgi:hypothetical protein
MAPSRTALRLSLLPAYPIASCGLRPSFVPSVAKPGIPLKVGQVARWDTAIRAADAALPQGSSLRSGLFCPGPSTLNRPHPSHSQARHDFPAEPVIRGAFAVRERLGDPRVVPCFRCAFFPDMPSSTPPERRRLLAPRHSSPTETTFASVLPLGLCLSRGALKIPPSASGGNTFRGFLVRCGPRPSLRPASSLAPLADRTASRVP